MSHDEAARQGAKPTELTVMSFSTLTARRSEGAGSVPATDNGSDSDLFRAISTSTDESETLSSMEPPGFGDYPWNDTDYLRDTLWPVELVVHNDDLGWNITYVEEPKDDGAYFNEMQRELNSSAAAREKQRRGHRRLVEVNSAELHNAMYIQYDRVTRGLGKVAWSGDLIVQAQEWAQYMASMNRIEHRFDLSSGVEGGWSIISENVCMNHKIGRDGAHEGLMNSEGHRANILDPRINRIGVGVRRRGIYFFMCQIFKAQVYYETEDD
jgi:uncharacterized protein YkwD